MSFTEGLRTEKIVFDQMRYLTERDPIKYAGLRGLWLASILDCEGMHIGRAAYFTIRMADDILDGDIRMPPNIRPRDFIVDLQEQIASDQLRRDSEISTLAHYSITALERRQQPGDNVRDLFAKALDPLVFDYDRARDRKLFTAQELEGYYWESFWPIQDIMLITLGSNLRSSDLRGFAMAQPRAYTVRDFREGDYPKGIINVPQEVMGKASLTAYAPVANVWENPIVSEWMLGQLSQAKQEALGVIEEVNASGEERLTKMFLRQPMRTVLKIVDEYSPLLVHK